MDDTCIEFPAAHLYGLSARMEAQKIAFGPVVFQCLRIAWKSGLLARIEQAGAAGASIDDLAAQQADYSSYAISVVLETALAAGALRRTGERYQLTRVGDNVLHDTLTQINIDYIHDVCYQGLFVLDESLRAEQPLGLKTLGDWPTIYEGLSALPEPARTSWFRFDHFYSDSAFAVALPHVLARRPRRLMDIGANTGKWSCHCLQCNPDVEITLVDLPIQLAQAERTLSDAGLRQRATLHPLDILERHHPLPAGMDAVWMSQFLTCFGLDEIDHILQRAAASLNVGGSVWILDTFWDRQKHDIASYCLLNTSPYFTALASGNSKMYAAETIVARAAAQGLHLAEAHDGLGICHSLLRFERQPATAQPT